MIKCLQLWWVNLLLTTINPPKTTIYVISNHREFNLDLVVEWGNARAVTIWDVDESEVIEPLQTTGSLAAMSDFLSWRTPTFSVIISLYYWANQLPISGEYFLFCLCFYSRPQKSHALNFRSFHQNRWRSNLKFGPKVTNDPQPGAMCCGINLGLSVDPISTKTPLSFCWFSKPYPPVGSSWWLIELSFQVVSRLHSWIAPGSHASQCYCLPGHLGHYGGGAVPDRSAPAAKIK